MQANEKKMLAILENVAKDVNLMKTDYEGRIGVLEAKMKRVDDNLINLVNMSYRMIHSSTESIKILVDRWEKSQAAKSFDKTFIDLGNAEKGKQVLDDKCPCAQTKPNLKISMEQAKINLLKLLKLTNI